MRGWLRPCHSEATQGMPDSLYGFSDDPFQPGTAFCHRVGQSIQFFRHVYVDVGFTAHGADLGWHILNFNRDPVAPEGDVCYSFSHF